MARPPRPLPRALHANLVILDEPSILGEIILGSPPLDLHAPLLRALQSPPGTPRRRCQSPARLRRRPGDELREFDRDSPADALDWWWRPAGYPNGRYTRGPPLRHRVTRCA